MYEPQICLSMDDAWEMATLLSNCASELAEQGVPEAERYYKAALSLYEAWFPTTMRYRSTCDSFVSYLRRTRRPQAVAQWEARAARLRTECNTRYIPWRFRKWSFQELEELPPTQRVLFALEASAQGMRDLNAVLREARDPVKELHLLLYEYYRREDQTTAPARDLAFLYEPEQGRKPDEQGQVAAATFDLDEEAVIALALLRRQMAEVQIDLALALAPSLPGVDERLKEASPPHLRLPTLTRYLATVIADLLNILEREERQRQAEEGEAEREGQQKRAAVIASAVTALRLATRVGAAPFPLVSAKAEEG
jgi:hypothetical protein